MSQKTAPQVLIEKRGRTRASERRNEDENQSTYYNMKEPGRWK